MQKVPVTAIVLTYNEELHLEKCLKSLSRADQVIVVDSHSTDRTQAIAKEFGAELIEHDFTNQAEQFNWTLDNMHIRNGWILRLDADEYVLPGLWTEIAWAVGNADPEVTGFYIKRRVVFKGRWIKHGGIYPSWFLRLFRKDEARSETRPMDEHIFLLSGHAEKLANDFVDENLQDLTYWTDKHNKYASREVAARLAPSRLEAPGDQLEKNRELRRGLYSRLPIFAGPFLYFFWRYFIRLGFLDGTPGLIFHSLHAFWYRFLVDAKLWEAKRKNK
jgi:glycosyltransferase involved in cell wall biosynthesis